MWCGKKQLAYMFYQKWPNSTVIPLIFFDVAPARIGYFHVLHLLYSVISLFVSGQIIHLQTSATLFALQIVWHYFADKPTIKYPMLGLCEFITTISHHDTDSERDLGLFHRNKILPPMGTMEVNDSRGQACSKVLRF